MTRPVAGAMLALALLLTCAGPAAAQVDDGDSATALYVRLATLQQRYERLRTDTERELAALARQIEALQQAAGQAGSGAQSAPRPVAPTADAVAAGTEGAARASDLPAAAPGGLDAVTLSGDFRLRYEHTGDAPDGSPARDRGVLRGRLAADYRTTERLTLGGRLVTGDPGDPNSADVTLGSFTDDLQVSLDRAYVRWSGGAATLLAGKFANPLAGTDLVWDGDVNPQGGAGRFRLFEGDAVTAAFTGIHALVDEQSAGADSTLTGGQLGLEHAGAGPWRAAVDLGYYDYHIGSLAGADAGDIRGNRLDATGTGYLSDFDLLDVVAEVTYEPAGARWPVTFSADFVRNLGAADGEDTGYSGIVAVGDLSAPGDLQLSYGYTVAETDAVFAAYSHDNITYATNYRLHALSLEYVPWPHMRLNLTGYRYRRNDPPAGEDDDPVTRLRLNWRWLF